MARPSPPVSPIGFFTLRRVGPKSDWYQNLGAGTLEGVWIGSKRHLATLRFLGSNEASEVMSECERAHPRTAKALLKGAGVSYDGTDEGRDEMMELIPMVAFPSV